MEYRIRQWATVAMLTGVFFLDRAAHAAVAPQAHNIILFVPDGLRAQMVHPGTAPAMAALRDEGVAFSNSHSLFPTFTTANASAMATGHHLGDTGDFSNTIYVGYPVPGAGASVTPFLESDPVLGDVDEHFAGDYLNAETILKAARKAGYNTASVGKLGPVLIFDHTERSGRKTVIADDATGSPNGIALAQWAVDGLAAIGLPAAAPGRGDNGKAGNAGTAGTLIANAAQQKWFADLFNKVVLKKFQQDGKPFVAVFWSRDPDGTQHNQGDSLNRLTPGINGPTSLAAIRNADDNLRDIRDTLTALGLADSTDIVIAADHGFSTISKQSDTSSAARDHYADVPAGYLPPGFLARDLSAALHLPLWDPDQKNAPVAAGTHVKFANGVLGDDPDHPQVVVAGNGGSDLIYLPSTSAKPRKGGKSGTASAHAAARRQKPTAATRKLAAGVIAALLAQDYISGIFVDSRLGKFPGTLTLADINLQGTAITPMPAIAVSFASFATECELPTTCAVEVADTGLQQGQGMHGSFSRADTYNFMAAVGPDFKKAYDDTAPVGNADVGRTIAHILKLRIRDKGKLTGRVMTEAMPGGKSPAVKQSIATSAPAKNGLRTTLLYQTVGGTRYFDAAGFPGRTVGLPPSAAPAAE